MFCRAVTPFQLECMTDSPPLLSNCAMMLCVYLMSDILEYNIRDISLSNMGYITKSIQLKTVLDGGKRVLHHFCVKLPVYAWALLEWRQWHRHEADNKRNVFSPKFACKIYLLSLLLQWKPRTVSRGQTQQQHKLWYQFDKPSTASIIKISHLIVFDCGTLDPLR